ncbi:hypothetical protein M514_11345 [Trichuris suis]|uniref:Uncharacterized protein n=1 Tax=Trichuris suis TaxID=68888 RepID=A0A085MTC4_9BILA|nr:hypothetical protein M513_11345 [Trichuris suis]KFD60470.1 hypothetical protein M514_11345 [Trichuris suis]
MYADLGKPPRSLFLMRTQAAVVIVRNGTVNNRNVNHANNKSSIIRTMDCQSGLREISGWDGTELERKKVCKSVPLNVKLDVIKRLDLGHRSVDIMLAPLAFLHLSSEPFISRKTRC